MASDNKLATFPFTRLPTELKLEVLRYHTLFLTNRSFIENCLHALTRQASELHEAFHPGAKDLVLLHYPEESKIFPFQFFQAWHEPPWSTHRYGEDLYWEGRKFFLSCHHQRPALACSELLWLRYLALVRFRIEEVLVVFDEVWYPSLRAEYTHTGLLHLWRFLGPFSPSSSNEPTSRLEYLASLPESQRWTFHRTLNDLAHDYAVNANLDFIHPFIEFRDHYRSVAYYAGIPWRSFTQCGAFAACVKQYILHLLPQELMELFCTRSEWTVFEPEKQRPHLLFDVHLRGKDIVLAPQGGQDELQSWDDFLEKNRLWALAGLAYTRSDQYLFRWVTEASAAIEFRGKMAFDRDAMCDARWVDGINYLGSDELSDLFRED